MSAANNWAQGRTQRGKEEDPHTWGREIEKTQSCRGDHPRCREKGKRTLGRSWAAKTNGHHGRDPVSKVKDRFEKWLARSTGGKGMLAVGDLEIYSR